MARTKTPDDFIEEAIEQIDAHIEEIDEKLAPYKARIQKWEDKRQSLIAARRALLGGNRSTGQGGNRVRQEDVIDYLKNNPGSSPTEMAAKFGVNYSVVASHLYRGKNERFLNKERRWWLRDPEAGVNTIEDIKED